MQPPEIPDHDLLRLIGRGAYGEVWLARNVMGIMRAVKIVRRDSFDSSRPFDREFAAVKRYEPVSRKAAGLVNVLHAGRAADGSHFHYVMELADSAEPGVDASAEPENYTPCTLRTQIGRMGRMPVAECLEVAVSLANGVADLHRVGLVHRDVKPSNIIFAGGRAKLADIGLVVDISESRSYVGTEGYVPPEGPGQPGADLFGLGRVLYEMTTGYEASRFPALPPEWAQQGNAGAFEFYEVVLRCCEPDAARRYQTADELLADLTLLQSGQSVRQVRQMRGRILLLRKVAVAAALAGLLGLAGTWWQRREAEAQRRLVARAESAEALAKSNLYEGLVQQARNARRNGEPDARFTALALLERAAALQQGDRQLREEFISTLATPGLRRINAHLREAPARGVAAFDAALTVMLLPSGTDRLDLMDAISGKAIRSVPLDGGEFLFAVRVSADGTLWVRDENGVLHATRPDGQTQRWTASGRGDCAWSVNAAGTRAVGWREDGTVTVLAPSVPDSALQWRAEQGFRQNVEPPPVLTLAGDVVALIQSGGQSVSLHRLPDGTLMHTLRSPEPLTGALAISADGSVVAAGLMDGAIGVWRTATPEVCERLEAGLEHISSLAMTPDGRFLVSASWASAGYLWDLADGTRLCREPLPAGSPFFSADGRTLVLDSGISTTVYEFEPAAVCLSAVLPRERLRSREGSAVRMALHPGSPWLLVPSDRGIHLVDGVQTAISRRWPLKAEDLAFRADGQGFFVSGRGLTHVPVARGPAGEWSAGMPEVRHVSEPGAGLLHIRTSSDGRVVAAWCADGQWRIFHHTPAGRNVITFPVQPDSDEFMSLSPDGKWLAHGLRYGGARILSTVDGQSVKTIPGKGSWTSATFSPDGTRIAVGDAGGMRLFRTGTWEQTGQNSQDASGDIGRNVWFAPSSRWALTAGRAGTITLHEPETGETIVALHRDRESMARELAMSADESMLWELDSSTQTLWRWNLHLLRSTLRAHGLDWTDAPLPPPIPSSAPPASGLVFLLPGG